MFEEHIFRWVIIGQFAAASFGARAATVETSDERRTLKLDMQMAASDLEQPFSGQGTFYLSPKEIGPSDNLQVMGRVNSTAILADIKPAGKSGNMFWVKIILMDLKQARFIQSAISQVAFPNSISRESTPVTMKADGKLVSKTAASGKLIEEPLSFEIKLKLHR